MSDHSMVAIFWDYENCSPPSNSSGLGYDIVKNISRIARLFGSVTTFRAYLDISAQSSKSVVLRSELQSSGVSMIDCPHNGRKDVVDKMILVDMLAFALDHPTPATIILITGDRDYAYAVSTLKLRKYHVILVVPSSPHTSPSLESQASLVIDWSAAVLRTRTEAVSSTQAIRQPYVDLDSNLVTKLLRELQDPPLDGPNANTHPYSNASQSTPKLRRISTRDLLEPSRHCKNIESFDSTQEFTDTQASPRKSTSTGSDSAGLPIPKTPSRSRRGSVSAESTRARSATIVAQSPPAVERDIPAINPPPSSARRSSVSDTTDVVSPTKRSPPALPSLDTLELPMHDSRPPSSIIVRSPLKSNQWMPTSGNPTIPSSSKLNWLASPFIMTKAPTGLGSIPSSCTKQSHTTARPTSPILPPTKTLPGTVTSVCETPRMKNIGVPTEIKPLRIEDGDTNSRRSIPHPIHSKEGTRNATDTPMSNYHSYIAPHTAGLHLADTPSGKHVSPRAPIPLGDSVDSQSVTFSRTSNTPDSSTSGSESVPSSSAFPSTLFTTESCEHDESGRRQTRTMFKPLIDLLLAARERGIARPTRSTIAVDLVQSDKQVYQRAGVSKFRDYTALAEEAGIIELGGKDGGWIALHPNWFGVDGIATSRSFSNRVSSPTSDPLQAVQNPLLTGRKSPLIESTAIFRTPAFTSPQFNSPENSNTVPTSPTDRQDCASRASIPAQFQPLIDMLIRMRAEGFHQILRSVVGQMLSQDVYVRAGVSGFKEYVLQASEAQLVQCGGIGGHAWIRLHPELRI
ncbi:DUF537-domain-containing protein [Imleria badia]|nr:DUF537-domain-containing protein [Imleria badia]